MSNMKERQDRRREGGIVTIELLIAFALGVVMLTGATLISFGGQSAALDVNLTENALYRAGTNLGDNVAALAASWDSPSLVDESDFFYTHTASSSFISPCVKLVTGGVSWTSEQNRGFLTELKTLLGSVTEAKKFGGDCDPIPPGDWDAPSSYPINDPIFAGSKASDIDVIRQNGKRFAILTAWKNPSPGGDTFWMVDTTDLDADPMPYSSFDTGDDLLAVDAIPSFAFVAGATTSSQKPFQILDVSDSSNITLMGEASLPNAELGNGRSVYYYDNGIVPRVYIGTQYLPCPSCGSGVNDEFHIFDVFDPASPIWEASINVQRNVNDIVVYEGVAYLATGPGGDNTVLKMYDVDPASATYLSLLGEYAAPTAQQGTVLYLLGEYVFLGRERPNGSGTTNSLFLVINVSDPASPTLADAENLNVSKGTAVEGVHVKGNLAFIVTSDQNGNGASGNSGDGPFIIYDVSDPTNIGLVSFCSPLNWSEKSTGLDMADDYAFVSNKSNDALRVIYPSLSCL